MQDERQVEEDEHAITPRLLVQFPGILCAALLPSPRSNAMDDVSADLEGLE